MTRSLPRLMRRLSPRSFIRRSVAVTALLLAAGTAHGQAAAGVPVIRVFDTKSNQWTTFDAMIARLVRSDIVFFGEQHDDPDTHAAELAVLAAVGGARPQTVLSLEMFERDVQPVLDRYLAGTGSESTFVAASRPWDRYDTDYRSLVELARVRGWPVLAANIPRRIASSVSRAGIGTLDTLPQPERGFAAAQNLCPRDAYYEKFAVTMQGHGAGGGPATATDSASMRAMTDRFYEAQCTKDEAMAESIVRGYGAAGKNALLLHVNGSFHSDFGLGTASRVKRRLPKVRVALVTAVPVPDITSVDVSDNVARADFLIYTSARKP